jgi:hypothetical protein
MPIYEIRVRGHLPAGWADWLGDLTLEHAPDGTSVLTGEVLDQAALYGVLLKLRDLGVDLLSVTPQPPPTQ